MLGKVEICGVNTANLKVLKNEEMAELLRRVKKGDKEARQKMIEGNLRLVLSVIQRFANRGENMDDLFQIGCVGLIKAIDNFDPDLYDVRFSTYGVPMISGEIRRFLRDSSAMRVSRSLRDTAYRVLQAREQYISEHQKEPTVEVLAKLLDIRREDVVMAMDAIADPVSLYEPVYSDSGDTVCVMDQVKDNKNTDENWLEHIALREAMSQLPRREQEILRLRFFEGRTQMEVSPTRSGSARPRFPDWKKTPCGRSARRCKRAYGIWFLRRWRRRFSYKSSTNFLIIFANLRKCWKGLLYQAFPAFCVSEDTPHIMAYRSLIRH